MRLIKISILLWTISSLLSAPMLAKASPKDSNVGPKNIVIMIGDGMGPAYTTAYRYYKDSANAHTKTEAIKQTIFDRLLVGMASTSPARVNGYVTDSAAAATALATGVKTYNGAIGVDTHKQPLTTLFEKAKSLGLSTGVAVTCQINHATPAGFLTHNEERTNYNAIAASYLETGADVLFGGGQRYFTPELIEQFTAKGYQYLTHMEDLPNITRPKVLGLFAEVQLPLVVDEPEAKKLSRLTSKALDLLSQNEQGFILLVEGSQIDWAGHNNDIAAAMGEMDEFANTVAVVEKFVNQHPDTLMLITADHSTGGLSIGSDGIYNWQPQLLHHISASIESLAGIIINQTDWQAELTQKLGLTLSTDELAALEKIKAVSQTDVAVYLRKCIDKRTYTGWTTLNHTGTDVQVFAAGASAYLFQGHQDNTDIAKKLFHLLPQQTIK